MTMISLGTARRRPSRARPHSYGNSRWTPEAKDPGLARVMTSIAARRQPAPVVRVPPRREKEASSSERPRKRKRGSSADTYWQVRERREEGERARGGGQAPRLLDAVPLQTPESAGFTAQHSRGVALAAAVPRREAAGPGQEVQLRGRESGELPESLSGEHTLVVTWTVSDLKLQAQRDERERWSQLGGLHTQDLASGELAVRGEWPAWRRQGEIRAIA